MLYPAELRGHQALRENAFGGVQSYAVMLTCRQATGAPMPRSANTHRALQILYQAEFDKIELERTNQVFSPLNLNFALNNDISARFGSHTPSITRVNAVSQKYEITTGNGETLAMINP